MTAITGAAIGFLVWAVVATVGLLRSEIDFKMPVLVAEIAIFTGSGGAIGWLVG